MLDLLSDITMFVEPVGLAVILVYTYGFFSRSAPSANRLRASMGTLFGLASIAAMASPMPLSDGIFIDLRNLFVGISAAFFGWRAVAITLFMVASMRIGIGGDGALAGLVSAIVAAGMGLIWRQFVRPRISRSRIALPVLATMISCHLIGAFVFPPDIAVAFLKKVGLPLVILNFAGTAIFAILISREQALMGETTRLLHAATTDPLTKILNRRSVIERYGLVARANAPRRGAAMVCIDVDQFKAINDTYGHLAGDKVLVELSTRITSCLRTDDLFARMSGDEFLIVLTNVASHEAHLITERCRTIVSRAPIAAEGKLINTTISIGTVWSPKLEEFGEFRDAADAALYHAKSAGRDCVAFNGKHDFDFQHVLGAA